MFTNALLAITLMVTLLPPPGQPKPYKDGDFQPAKQSQVVSWQLKRLPPPSSVYITVDDVLRAAVASSQANEVVTISYRWIRAADGKLDYGQFTVAPASDRSIKVQDQPMAEGFLLSVSCKAAVATTRGQTFVRLFLNPKVLGAGQPGFMLMSDYVTTRMAPGHPNGRILAPTEGPGWTQAIQVVSPGANADWLIAVPANARWRIVSVFATFQTDATPGDRSATIKLQQPAVVVWDIIEDVPPSFFASFQLAPGVAVGTTGNVAVNGFVADFRPIPPLILLGGGLIASATTFVGLTDQWFTLNFSVEEWLDNV